MTSMAPNDPAAVRTQVGLTINGYKAMARRWHPATRLSWISANPKVAVALVEAAGA